MTRIALVLLVACSAPATPPPRTPAPQHRDDPPVDVATLLASPADRRAARVAVQGRGLLALDLTSTGNTTPLDECHNFEAIVLEERGDWLRIVERGREVALAIWVPERYLGDVVMQRTPLLPTRDLAQTPNVWLLPGAPLRVLERDATHARVELRQLNDQARGWIDARALGITYTRSAPPAPPASPARVDTTQPILDAPNAAATSTFATTFSGPYERVGERNGYTELAYRSEWLDARGFVETVGIKPPGPTGMCESMHTQWYAAVHDRRPDDVYQGSLAVPEGTCLRARADGPIVGVQRAPATREVSVDRTGTWARGQVAMMLGTHTVWMRVTRTGDGFAIVPGC